MAKHYFIDRDKALDALEDAIRLSSAELMTSLKKLPVTETIEISSPTALNAVEYIKDYCDSQKRCDGCCFYKEFGDDSNSNKACHIGCPENWDISSIEQKWRTLHERA